MCPYVSNVRNTRNVHIHIHLIQVSIMYYTINRLLKCHQCYCTYFYFPTARKKQLNFRKCILVVCVSFFALISCVGGVVYLRCARRRVKTLKTLVTHTRGEIRSSAGAKYKRSLLSIDIGK